MRVRACVRARVYVLANLFVQIMTVTATTTEKETITDGMWNTPHPTPHYTATRLIVDTNNVFAMTGNTWIYNDRRL